MEPNIEFLNFQAPPFAVKAAPVLWEPHAGSGERIVALVLIRPDHDTAIAEIPPKAHIVFQQPRLRALLGAHRAASAAGILQHVALYMTDELLRGKSIPEANPPFQGFTVGKETRVRGYSFEQILNSAVRTVSAFGTDDGQLDERIDDFRNTVTTGRFIQTLRTTFSDRDDERRSRFCKTVRKTSSDPEMTIDYAHRKHLVQVTSLPTSERQVSHLQKEAESKILELDITVNSIMDGHASPSLLVNTEGLYLPDATAKHLAGELFDRIRYMGKTKNTKIFEARSPRIASELLEKLQ